MKRLIVCADGTWNTPDQEELGRPTPTNVHQLYSAVAATGADGVEQRRYYHPGVGTDGGWFARTAGGAWGSGLGRNIQSAYRWLGANYEPGDDIFLFGFSRGAFTVRSLGGMLSACGLLDLKDIADHEVWLRVEAAYDYYRKPPSERNAAWPGASWRRLHEAKAPVRFLGVWDTVGALGIPDDLSVLNLFDSAEKWRFHDTRLGDHIRTARHALALDERRASFTPTHWNAKPGADALEMWFAGVHSDVGGGYAYSGLANIALQWMIDEARQAGLGFRDELVAQIQPDPRCVLHDSYRGAFAKLRSRPRAIPPLVPGRGDVHPSVIERQKVPPIKQAPYRPTRMLGVGETGQFQVYARDRWNDPGLYLEPGDYRFAATGEWLDKNVSCGPGGTADGNFQLGEVVHVAAGVWGWVEKGWKKMTGNDGADFVATRRMEDLPWFALVGVVANDQDREGRVNDGSASPHECFLIGEGCDHSVARGGYFHAFANDAWDFYDNNSGSVRLTITRLR